MNEINPKYENTRKIHRLLTNQNPGFLYKVILYTDISCWGGVFAKNTSRETKNFPSRMARKF